MWAAILLGALAPLPSISQAADAPVNAIVETGMTSGVVRKLDNERQKITLQHEALENLGMPTMTMVFRLGNVALVETVKVGDRVMFRAERINGAHVVTKLVARPHI